MNEVLDPKFSMEENQSAENNLPEAAEATEQEKPMSEKETLATAESSSGESLKQETAQPPLAEEEVAAPTEEPTETSTEPVTEEASPEPAEPEEKVEAPAEEVKPAEEALAEKPTAEVSSKVAEIVAKLSREDIIEKIQLLIEESIEKNIKSEIDSLKSAYHKLRKSEEEEEKKLFIEEGGAEADFKPSVDETGEKLKELLGKYREKKAELMKEEDKIREANLNEKKGILEKIKDLIDSQDDFNKIYNEFKNLQQRWKELKLVPHGQGNELWKEFQLFSEKFYDLRKINNEMRIYDFKKNLELKNALIESVQKLDEEPDVVSAFHQLQSFHQEWREIGPVSPELREEVWAEFKVASSVINKKHQAYFETLRGKEQENLEEKTSICEEIETIRYEDLKSFKQWDQMSKRVLELQQTWKGIGFAPKKFNVKIFDRFRSACDVFFQKKSDFYKEVKAQMEDNLEKKKALCEQVEALKDSTDWKETTNQLIALQKEWKTIGTVSRKHSDAIWKRFISACDHFFEQKNQNFQSQKSEETENLQLKKDLIDKINGLDENLDRDEALTTLREWMAEWGNIGHVPFRQKDKIYKEFRAAVDKHFDRLKIDQAERRLQSFKSSINDLPDDNRSQSKLLNERDKLMRSYEKLKSDIQTFENNVGFFSVTSKGGGGLLKEMERKIENLKAEQDLVLKKIQAIDDNLDESAE